MFQPSPLAKFLLRFSVTNLHTPGEQKFAASLHKEPVILSIAFHTSTDPFPVEPDLQSTSRGQGNGWQGWLIRFANAIAAISVQHQDTLMQKLPAHHGSCAFRALRRTVLTGITAVSPTGCMSISRGVSPVGVGVSASC